MAAAADMEILAGGILAALIAGVVVRALIWFRRHTRYRWVQGPFFLLNLIYTRRCSRQLICLISFQFGTTCFKSGNIVFICTNRFAMRD